MFENVNRNPNIHDLRKFALTLLLGMPVVGGIWTGIIWWSQDILNLWILAVFSAIGIMACSLSLISKPAGRLIYICWHTFGAIIEMVISLVSTLIMYYLTIVPIGIIMRLIGREPLQLRIERDKETYWKDCKKNTDLKRYFRQY